MHYTNLKRLDVKMRAIEDALSRIGEPITEAQAKSVAVLEDCECKDGMFALAATRRQLFDRHGARRRGWNDRDAAARRPTPRLPPARSNTRCQLIPPKNRPV